jgi:hypothetical protein
MCPHRAIVGKVLEKSQASALEMIDLLLTMENKGPSTVHDPQLASYREGYLQGYRQARIPEVYIAHPPHPPLKPEEVAARDPYDQTLFYMANARAYFLGSHLQLPLIFGGSLIMPFSRVPTLHRCGSDDDRSTTSART